MDWLHVCVGLCESSKQRSRSMAVLTSQLKVIGPLIARLMSVRTTWSMRCCVVLVQSTSCAPLVTLWLHSRSDHLNAHVSHTSLHCCSQRLAGPSKPPRLLPHVTLNSPTVRLLPGQQEPLAQTHSPFEARLVAYTVLTSPCLQTSPRKRSRKRSSLSTPSQTATLSVSTSASTAATAAPSTTSMRPTHSTSRRHHTPKPNQPNRTNQPDEPQAQHHPETSPKQPSNSPSTAVITRVGVAVVMEAQWT